MKKDWTYKKLGEVGSIITGNTPSTKDVENYSSNDVCFFKPSDIETTSITLLNKSEYYISEYAYKKARKLPKDTVLTTCIGIIGKVGILAQDSTCNQQINAIIPNTDIVLPRYLAYAIFSLRHILQETANAPVVPLLNKTQFSNFPIPVPPISIQESIVLELDAIHGILEKKQEQLRELDNLAQAIFYEMFGDPITNPKQWEVKKLIELVHKDCPVSYGIVQPGDGEEKGVPVVRPVDLKDSDYIGRENLKLTTQEISDSYSRTILRGDEILICVRGTTGLLGLVSSELKGCNVTRGIVPLFFADDIATKLFIFAALKTPAIQSIIADKTYGATLKQINIKDLRDIEFPLPPLSLQQSFAAKIEAIEAQKQAITQSIHHTEALLAQRMDQYFA